MTTIVVVSVGDFDESRRFYTALFGEPRHQSTGSAIFEIDEVCAEMTGSDRGPRIDLSLASHSDLSLAAIRMAELEDNIADGLPIAGLMASTASPQTFQAPDGLVWNLCPRQ